MNGLSWMIKLLREQLADNQPVRHILDYRTVQRENVRKEANRVNQQRHRARVAGNWQGESVPRPKPVEKLVNLDWQGD
jgi:hypothetical protein